MTEEESRLKLFKLNKEYMKHTKEERLKLYDEYRLNREIIQEQLKEGQKLNIKLK